jgi:hypothetical protein
MADPKEIASRIANLMPYSDNTNFKDNSDMTFKILKDRYMAEKNLDEASFDKLMKKNNKNDKLKKIKTTESRKGFYTIWHNTFARSE